MKQLSEFIKASRWTWCRTRVWLERASKTYPVNHSRSLFSKTGVWDKEYTRDVRRELEPHWKERVMKKYERSDGQSDKPKFYVLSMFPYPSGKLHMGHVRVYTISDTIARYHRMTGKQVIHPMGWDAFGLPAENAAIERGEMPDQWTYKNIASMREQLNDLCCVFDWDREFATCDPEYYRWTQFIFLKLYNAGLVYQKEALVNWDPVDETVLADEQIDEDGCSWRSGAKVDKVYLRQWYIRTTAYSKSLVDGLNEVNPDFWKDIILLQKNWIGQCNGCRLEFQIQGEDGVPFTDPLSVFTTVPEAVYGISYIAVAPTHRLNQAQYYKKSTDHDKEVIPLTITATHPFTGEAIPLFVSQTHIYEDREETDLGIPCVFDEDYEFAHQFGLLPATEVFENSTEATSKLINSAQFSGMDRDSAFKAITDYAKGHGFGGHLTSAGLNDWLISRQRYWGTPIPIIHCPKCQAVPVPPEQLPVRLPVIKDLAGKGRSPLSQAHDWLQVKCPKCGSPAQREMDTMDTFVDSTWYFLRYLDIHNEREPVSRAVADRYMPVDLYIGGKEHAVLHLYFARFINHFLCDQGYLKSREPFTNLLTQGMVMGQSYRIKGSGKYISKEQVDLTGNKLVEKETGLPVIAQWEKMSKSKYNGVDPQDMLSEYGVEATRLCILSNVAPKSNRQWSIEEYVGIMRWQSQIWRLVGSLIDAREEMRSSPDDGPTPETMARYDRDLFDSRNFFLKEVTFHFNKTFLLSVAVSRLQGLVNSLKKTPPDVLGYSVEFERALTTLVIMLAPFAPSFASELWAGLASVPDKSSEYSWENGVLEQDWPEVDMHYTLPLVVQSNGRQIYEIRLPRSQIETLTAEEALEAIRSHELFQKYCAHEYIEKTVFRIEPSYEATLNLILPNKASQQQKQPSQKKKKKKKAKVVNNSE